MLRDEYCGKFSEKQLGKKVQAAGWVSARRDMGGVIFIDLVDKTGTLQVVFNLQNISAEDFAAAERLRSQSVIMVAGILEKRDEETVNPKIPTGQIELRAQSLAVLSQAATLPFSLDEDNVREDLRLRYRYLDLRRAEMQHNLRFRHMVQKAAQDYLDSSGFLSVETPMLTKSTPEGARDYLVPSRVHNGSFYALPQSPQIFKQLLMVGGIDKYYQVARCFRDEDLRADRQPEFTQVDLEMSFVEQEDILVLLEDMFKSVYKEVTGNTIDYAFPRITWHHAMDVYGSDKPDLRFALPIVELTTVLENCSFEVFRKVIKSGGVVRAINVKGGAAFTRSDIENLTAKAESYGAKGMAWIAVKEDGELYSILTKYFSKEDMDAILHETKAEPGDFILFCADKLNTVRRTLGGLRCDIADIQNLRNPDVFQFLFVTDFPQFEYSEEEKRYISTHHPFTMPYPEDVDKLKTDPGAVRAQAFDVVLNGVELGSGSIRIHNSEVQQLMFEALGLEQDEIADRFGFMVEAFRYGTPPHGGFAFGLDRLVMLLLKAESLRKVIAFPKNREGVCPMTNAPGIVDAEQLEALSIQLAADVAEAAGTSPKHSGAVRPNIDVDRIAQLARLKINPDEKAEMEKDLHKILTFAGQLSAIDTEGVEPTLHINHLQNIMREDTVLPPLDRSELLAGSALHNDEYIIVPKVVE